MPEPKVKPGYVHDRDERSLTKRHRDVLHSLHEGRNQNETAKHLGISRARVGQIVKELTARGFLKREGRKVVIDVNALIG